jgi:hypothetical protein
MIPFFPACFSPGKKSAPARKRSFWDVLTGVVASNPTPAPDKALQAINELRTICTEPDDYLFRLLRMAALHRSVVIQQHLLQTIPPVVQSGPFAGMTLSRSSKEGCYIPKLLGSYEAALHPEWLRVIQYGYTNIVNIGCADGYYTVGLARHLPHAKFLAYDSSNEARESCLNLARLNNVETRIQIGGEFKGTDFERLPTNRVFLMCDIEGAERELLNPQLFTNLCNMDLLVEMHQIAEHQTDKLIEQRFKETHFYKKIEATMPDIPVPQALSESDELDKLLAIWEWRIQPTPWAILLSKAHHQSG